MKVVSLALMGFVVMPAVTAASDDDDRKSTWPPHAIAALVRQLGDNTFAVRERAANQLIRLGRTARPALEAGLKDPDLEIRRRCQQLLPLALKQDLENRLAAFLADKQDETKHDLPGWQRYQKLVGAGSVARQFFADIFRADAELLEAAAGDDPKRARAKFYARCQHLHEMSANPSAVGLADLANLLLVAGDARVALEPVALDLFSSLLVQQLPRQLTGGPRADLTKKMLAAWMKQRAQAGIPGQVLTLAFKLHLKEGLDLAVQVLREKQAQANDRATAAMVVGWVGGREHLPLLEPLLSEATQVGSFAHGNVSGTTQVGDVALAMLVRLSGQKLADYGYPAADLSDDIIEIHGPAILGFPEGGQREASKKKWRDWVAKQGKK
jgi:hypothetical protein